MKKSFAYLFMAVFIAIPSLGYSVQVSFFLGDVSLMRSGKKIAVAVGQTLQSGDQVKTGANSFLEIQYKDGSKIKINQSSTATIGSKNIAGSDQVSILAGTMTGTFQKLSKGSSKAYSQTITCSVRGTEYTISVSESGDSRVDVSDGIVDVSNPYGKKSVKKKESVESPFGDTPKKSSGSADDWKKKSDANFSKDPGGTAEKMDRHLDTFNLRSKETADNMKNVKSAVSDANSKESLEQAENLLNDASEKTEDDLFMNEAIDNSLQDDIQNYKGKDDDLYEKYSSIEKKSNRVEEQQKKNYNALKKIREDYEKAYEKIMGRYQNKLDEIKNRFKNKKSDIN